MFPSGSFRCSESYVVAAQGEKMVHRTKFLQPCVFFLLSCRRPMKKQVKVEIKWMGGETIFFFFHFDKDFLKMCHSFKCFFRVLRNLCNIFTRFCDLIVQCCCYLSSFSFPPTVYHLRKVENLALIVCELAKSLLRGPRKGFRS